MTPQPEIGHACACESLLLPYQVQWIADDSLVALCTKSRRIGITWAEALRAVVIASTNEPRVEIVPGRWIASGQDVWYQVYSVDDGKRFIEDVQEFATLHTANMQAAGVQWRTLQEGHDMLVRSVRFPWSRKRITVIAGKPRSWRNKGGIAIIDEAEFLDNLEESISAVRPYLARGGRLRIISSAGAEGSTMHKLVREIESGFYGEVEHNDAGTVAWSGSYSHHTYTLEHAREHGCLRRTFDRERLQWSPAAEQARVDVLYQSGAADREYRCKRTAIGDSYIPEQWIQAARRARPVFRWTFPAHLREVPRTDDERRQRRDAWRAAVDAWIGPVVDAVVIATEGHPAYIGQDYASKVHTSAVAVAIATDTGLDFCVGVELKSAPQAVQQMIIEAIAAAIPNLIAGGFDERGNGETHVEELRWSVGEHMIGYSQSEQWYRDTIPMLRRLFENGDAIIPDDSDCASDFARYTLNKRGVPVMGAPLGPRHGDFAQACSFIVRAWIENPPVRLTASAAPAHDYDDDEDDRGRY